MRDGLSCIWDGAGIEEGAILSLDHLKCHSHGGTNESTNLVTSCTRCNSSRGNRGVREFAKAMAIYLDHDIRWQDIERRVRNQARKALNMAEAKDIFGRGAVFGSRWLIL